ncbi:MAG TPA: alpha-glucosidase C-terminal domain-containing protein, partial [Petrotogaceae bacterium]|nr:alpha-glucosidase C-terminal domain-containing protein [Petrotogaceae bacterium]
GGKDPFCRKPFPWDKDPSSNDIYSIYKTLTTFRAENPALKYGSLKFIYSKLGLLAYEREFGEDKVIVVINSRSSSNSCNIELDSQYKDLFSKAYYKKIETVGPKEVLILYRER